MKHRNKNIINDRQQVVIETMRLRLSEKQALVYLKSQGFDIHPATYYRDKAKVEKTKLQRLYQIAAVGFEDQHLETIEELKLAFKMLWANVLRERDPYRQSSMIKDLIMLKPYLSAYHEATKLIIEKQSPIVITPNESERQESNSISSSERISGIDDNRKF
jgi:hydrogenase maturation factor HypF (carbamoyltransferase family)